MQKTLAFLMILIANSPAQAESRDVRAYCHVIGEFARTIMQNRQAGATMTDMMAAKAPSPEFQNLGETLITAAFREPLAGSDELRQRAVNAFENSTTTACNSASAKQP